MKVDCFMFNSELDMLECRLTELQDVIDVFILCEAPVTHGGNQPKPLWFKENQDRFAQWNIMHVIAENMPSDPDPWSREHAQREAMLPHLDSLGLTEADVIYQSDLDEIPRADVVAHLEPTGFVVLEQDLYSFAVDWLHPEPWRGTVACRRSQIVTMTGMRDARNWAPTVIPDAGWHLSWLGGPQSAEAKLDAFCHPEIEERTRPNLEMYYREGYHVDGKKLFPTDGTDLPKWVMGERCPPEWWRPWP